MKRLLSWLTGALVMASLMAGLVLPSSVYADDDLRSKYSGNEIRNIADDKIGTGRQGGFEQLLRPSFPAVPRDVPDHGRQDRAGRPLRQR